MGYDEKESDREKRMAWYFNPDDVTKWLEYPPEEFIATMIHELREENLLIQHMFELLSKSLKLEAMTLKVNDQQVPGTFFAEGIPKATRIIDRLLDTAAAHKRGISEKNRGNSSP